MRERGGARKVCAVRRRSLGGAARALLPEGVVTDRAPAEVRQAVAMRRLRSLNLGQRIVLVVALAAALRTAGTFLVNRRDGGGWFSYAPLGDASIYPAVDSGWHPVQAAILWIALIALWAAVSVWLLGPQRRD